MLISGLQKLTLLDYPGTVACTVFTGGCNFRCPFCHNSALVLPEELSGADQSEQVLAFLKKRVGVLDGVSLPSIEIIPKTGFYDYKNKYQAGATTEICPSPIDRGTEVELRAMALKVHQLLGLGSYSRSDYIVDEQGDVYFIEINTLPGMTPTSLMPQEAAAVGVDFEALCRRIIAAAVGEGAEA